MITKPTTLILGAGASCDYDFPTGQALRERIINKIISNNWDSYFEYFGIKRDRTIRFAMEFKRSAIKSIDAFIEKRPEFLDIGKISIALALIPDEKENILYDTNKWYGYLQNILLANCPKIDNFKSNELFIVTFNYDRSLDHFLIESLKYSFHAEENKCLEALEGILPMHVYGQLGKLPCQSESSRSYIPNLVNIDIAFNGIQLMVERESQPAIIQNIHKSLWASDRIYFLGFGYDPINLSRLKIDSLKNKEILGTSRGLGKTEKETIESKWPIVLPDDSDGDVLRFLKNYARLD